MKEIQITRGMTTIVDDDVYKWASKLKWFAGSGTAGKWYAARTERVGGKRTTVYLHRLIAGRGGQDVDHRDGNTLDNQRHNLRAVTHQVNQRNRKGGYGVTGVRNVTILPSGRFRVVLGPKSGPIRVGVFDTLDEASRAASEARVTHYGEV